MSFTPEFDKLIKEIQFELHGRLNKKSPLYKTRRALVLSMTKAVEHALINQEELIKMVNMFDQHINAYNNLDKDKKGAELKDESLVIDSILKGAAVLFRITQNNKSFLSTFDMTDQTIERHEKRILNPMTKKANQKEH